MVGGGGDSSLAGKATPPTVPVAIQAAFATAAPPPARSSRRYTTEEQGHGREEPRPVPVLPAHGHLSSAPRAAWLGMLRLVRVPRVVWCEATGRESSEGR
jgi:hypothetical protein